MSDVFIGSIAAVDNVDSQPVTVLFDEIVVRSVLESPVVLRLRIPKTKLFHREIIAPIL